MRAVTGCPIKLLGVGEKLDALEDFHPSRIAGRILGMGDVVSLVEKAAETIEQDEAEKLAAKMQKGKFDLDDLPQQLKQLQKMGGLGGVMGMLPGVGKIQKQLVASQDRRAHPEAPAGDHLLDDQGGAPKPELIKASRKQRIANGSGVSVADVNKLLKQHHGNAAHDEADEQARPEGPDAPRPLGPDAAALRREQQQR